MHVNQELEENTFLIQAYLHKMDSFCFLVLANIGICGFNQRYPHPKLSKGIPVNTHPNQVYIIPLFKKVLELLIVRKSVAGFDVVQPDIAK